MAESRAVISAGVEPSRVILRDVRVERIIDPFGVELSKGGLSKPGLGETRNFWFEGGMEKSLKTAAERSERVALDEKVRCSWEPL